MIGGLSQRATYAEFGYQAEANGLILDRDGQGKVQLTVHPNEGIACSGQFKRKAIAHASWLRKQAQETGVVLASVGVDGWRSEGKVSIIR